MLEPRVACRGWIMIRTTILVCGLLALLGLSRGQTKSWQVKADFPGGNVRVLLCDESRKFLQITPQVHEGRGWNCWWYFCVEGLSVGETLTLEVLGGPCPGSVNRHWSTPDRIVYSTDNRNWKQSQPGTRGKDAAHMSYHVPIEAERMWLAWGPPFTWQHAREIVQVWGKHPSAKAWTLCKSKEGREVPAIRVTDSNKPEQAPVVWIQARQHAWEAGSSWVAKGLGDWLLSEDAEASRLRHHAVIFLVPIMDVDNVERGAGGKNQLPHDHNRDWSDNPVWPEVRAAQAHLRELYQAKRLQLFVDLHNPGPRDAQPFFHTPSGELLSAQSRERLDRFIQSVRQQMAAPLPLSTKTVESGASYDPKLWRQISTNWVSANCPGVVAACLETPWNTPHSTVSGYARVGEGLGRGIARFLLSK